MYKILENGCYYGSVIKKKDFSNIIITETFYAESVSIPVHFHTNPYYCYVLKGQYREIYGKSNLQCTTDDIVVHPAFAEHSNHFGERGGACLNIEINKSTEMAAGIIIPAIGKIEHALFPSLFKKIYTEFRTDDEQSALIIEGLLLQLTGYGQRQSKSIGPYWLKKAMAMALENKDNPYSLSYIAHSLHVTPSHLAREFKKANGYSIGEFIRIAKINRACTLLQNRKLDILDISIECGFADQSHFTRTFKKIMGTTPWQYRSLLM